MRFLDGLELVLMVACSRRLRLTYLARVQARELHRRIPARSKLSPLIVLPDLYSLTFCDIPWRRGTLQDDSNLRSWIVPVSGPFDCNGHVPSLQTPNHRKSTSTRCSRSLLGLCERRSSKMTLQKPPLQSPKKSCTICCAFPPCRFPHPLRKKPR